MKFKKKHISILHIIGSGSIGGAENFVYQIAKYQKERNNGLNSAILFRNGRGYFFQEAIHNNITVHSFFEKINLKTFTKIIRLFRSYDILHFHGLYPVLFWASIISNTKSIYYIHGARSLTKSVNKVIQNVFYQWKFPSLKGFRRFFRRQFFKLYLNYYVKSIQAPSQFYVNFYINRYKIFRDIVRLPYGIDLEKMTPVRSSILIKQDLGIIDEKVIGCVSTFRGLKRIDRLVKGYCEYLKYENNEKETKLIIVGDGKERENIQKLIHQLDLENYIILTGFRTDIPNLLNIFDVFVLPSEFESFSIATIEAMYFKLPIIVFRESGGLEELVSRSKSGFIVENEQELAMKISILINSHENAEKIGVLGHRYVKKNLSIDIYEEKIREIYNCALK